MRRVSPMVQRRGGDVDMDSAMTPMIDVVFLLLVFFVWTASFQIVEQILPSEMSSQIGSQAADNLDPPPESDFDDIVISIGWDGAKPNWTFNTQSIGSVDQLNQKLLELANVQIDATVIIDPDGLVPLGEVISVYDLSKLAGFAKVSFAVNPAAIGN